ncbi:MAG: exosome complex RNA-binding protein Csl4 [Candidatus Heimdallarchaeota archaeon]|nr:exosome complex RNA-binding protein Csl4 [Candidatus Heimdallarchaeota archaeon]
MKDKRKSVFPSEKLGNEEEFLASDGAYTEEHEVRSSVFGKIFINKERYRASVIPYQTRKLSAKRYDVVIGEIINVGKNSLRVNISYLNDKPVIPSLSAIMHISDSSKDFVNSLDDLYCSGDYIRATIIDAKTIPLQLETKASNSGVIYTLCEKCGGEVKKLKRDHLECVDCEHVQQRKTAIDFGNVNLIAEY